MKTTILLSYFFLAAAANASTVFINFGSAAGGNLGATHTFSGVIATADPTSGGNNLYQKMAGGDENGLGLTSDDSGDHEITPAHYIQLDISAIMGDNPFSIIMESSTGNDGWSVYETNSANTSTFNLMGSGHNGATLLLSGSSEGTDLSLGTVADKYIDITATAGNVLLGELDYTTSSVPEPASLALGGLGLVTLGLLRRRKA